jgi:hypothetical protein
MRSLCRKLCVPVFSMPRQVRLVGPVVALAGKLNLPAGHSFEQECGVASFVETIGREYPKQSATLQGDCHRPQICGSHALPFVPDFVSASCNSWIS